jgi:GMP synthase (glutamine-hydrolysing)
MKRILALQHAWECPMGLLAELLDEYGLAYDTINVEQTPLPAPAAYDAIIALGGPQHVYNIDKYPYFIAEKALIQRAVADGIPFLGICLGAQLLAAALGGSVSQHSLIEIGFYDVPFTAAGQQDPLFANLPGYQKVFHWHEDAFELPPGGILLASNTTTRNQAFRYGSNAYGLQYHIELNSELLDLWLERPDFQQEIITSIGTDAFTTIQQERFTHYPLYHNHTSILCANFLRLSGLIVH